MIARNRIENGREKEAKGKVEQPIFVLTPKKIEVKIRCFLYRQCKLV